MMRFLPPVVASATTIAVAFLLVACASGAPATDDGGVLPGAGQGGQAAGGADGDGGQSAEKGGKGGDDGGAGESTGGGTGEGGKGPVGKAGSGGGGGKTPVGKGGTGGSAGKAGGGGKSGGPGKGGAAGKGGSPGKGGATAEGGAAGSDDGGGAGGEDALGGGEGGTVGDGGVGGAASEKGGAAGAGGGLGGGAGTPACRDACVSGAALSPTCSAGVKAICDFDGFCCDPKKGAWDSTCAAWGASLAGCGDEPPGVLACSGAYSFKINKTKCKACYDSCLKKINYGARCFYDFFDSENECLGLCGADDVCFCGCMTFYTYKGYDGLPGVTAGCTDAPNGAGCCTETSKLYGCIADTCADDCD